MDSARVNNYGQRRKIHLYYQPRKTKSRGVVHDYSLATCFYENGKNQKKILQRIGELTKDQADQYRMLLKALNGQTDILGVTDLEGITFADEKNYLDVLAMDALWKSLGLHKVFSTSTNANQRISTEQIARILTLNKLLDPSSKIKTIPWLQTTLLAKIMGIEEDAYERNKIFRELPQIHKHKSSIEKLFWRHSQKDQGEYDAYYFDGSTSWFEGSRCPLAEADLEKTRGFFPKVIGLMLITDNRGFPVAWEVVNGHTKDTTEFKEFIRRISVDFGISELTYCFDRGIASVENFDLVSKHDAKFISAIRDNQIKEVLDLEKFKLTRIKITDYLNEGDQGHSLKTSGRKQLGIDGFLSFDKNIFFKDLGVISGKRYVVSFNFELFVKEHIERNQRIDGALLNISNKNKELSQAKRDRDFNITERDLLDLFSKHRVRSFFEYKLLPLTNANKIQTFKIECEYRKNAIEEASLTDGILVYITDHIEKKNTVDFKLSARDIVAHYKGKHVVENAFREFKSFLELRPFFVWKEDHVKAHYDICVIACFINNFIARKMRKHELSLRDFHRHLAGTAKTTKLVSPKGLSIFKIKPISEFTKRCFADLGIAKTYSPALHKEHGVFQ